MPSTILVKDVLYLASSQLVDTDPQFERWTERELVSWLNDAQRAIAKYLPSSCSKVDAIKLAPGTRQSIEKVLAANLVPGDGSASVDTHGRALLDVHRNMGADGATPGTSIRLVQRERLDLNNNSWHTQAGSPVSLYTFDVRTPKVFYAYPPVPAAPAVWVEISWLIEPRAVAVPAVGASLYAIGGEDTTVLSVDDIFIDDILNYILARAHMKDAESGGNAQLAAGYTSLFTASLNAQAAALTGVNPNLKTLPFATAAQARTQ